ncbi:MAG: DMT family transporter [Bacteroidota bacterium]
MAIKNRNVLAWVLLLVLALIWGSSFILIKKGLLIYSALEVGAIRIVAAYLFLVPLAIRSFRNVERKHWPFLFSVGMFGSFLPAFLFAIAQTQIQSSLAGILNALTPLFTMLLGLLLFSQRVTLKVTLGLILGFLGSVVLMFSGNSTSIEFNAYALLVVLATIFYATNLNLIKYKLPDVSSKAITSLSLFLVGPVALIHLLFNTDFIQTTSDVEGAYSALGALSLLGVLGTAIALILFNELVKITSPIFTSSVTYIIPIVAVIWGLVDGESLFLSHYLGMLLIIFGVYIVNRKR